jgi:SAM-dependent methyltransferase
MYQSIFYFQESFVITMYKNDYNEIQSQLALPYLSSREGVLKGIFNILESKFNLVKKSKQSFIDLGSGNGIVVIYSGINYSIESIGIEINKNLIKEARDLIKSFNWRKRRCIKIVRGDLFQQNLEKFDFIYIFSLPSMQKFLKHVFRTAKKGAVVISYKFPLSNMGELLKTAHKSKIENVDVFFYVKS